MFVSLSKKYSSCFQCFHWADDCIVYCSDCFFILFSGEFPHQHCDFMDKKNSKQVMGLSFFQFFSNIRSICMLVTLVGLWNSCVRMNWFLVSSEVFFSFF